MAEIPEDLKEKYVYLVHRMAELDSERDRESYRANAEDNQQLSNLQAEKIYIERIATAEALVTECKTGWDSAISDLREAAEICRKAEARVMELETHESPCAKVTALKAEKERLKTTIKAVVQWLEKNQLDVFKRGLWDAVLFIDRTDDYEERQDAQRTAAKIESAAKKGKP